jgi:Tfp pilus assembly protein PilW
MSKFFANPSSITKGPRGRSGGFTIVELLVATVVFSGVLVILMAGVIYFTNTYYKGVTQSKTQTASRAAIDAVTQALQLSGESYTGNPTNGFVCIGNKRFSFIKNKTIVDTAPLTSDQTHHALVVDMPAGGCNDSSSGQYPLLSSRTTLANDGDEELLGQHMRLTEFSVTDQGSGLYEVKIGVASGDQDLLTTTGPGARCKSGHGSQFCATSILVTTVQQRVTQ